MYLFSGLPIPANLPADQRALWQRRQLTARNTLEAQARMGSVANAETVAYFQRYVQGEIGLGQAVAQARAQIAQERASFQRFLRRRNIV